MIKSVDPGLRVRLDPVYRTHVVRLTVVIPRYDLSECHLTPMLDKLFPARGPKPIVSPVNPIFVP